MDLFFGKPIWFWIDYSIWTFVYVMGGSSYKKVWNSMLNISITDPNVNCKGWTAQGKRIWNGRQIFAIDFNRVNDAKAASILDDWIRLWGCTYNGLFNQIRSFKKNLDVSRRCDNNENSLWGFLTFLPHNARYPALGGSWEFPQGLFFSLKLPIAILRTFLSTMRCLFPDG